MFNAFTISGSNDPLEFNERGCFIGHEGHADDCFGGGSGFILGSGSIDFIRQIFLTKQSPFHGCFIKVFEFSSEVDREEFFKDYGTDKCSAVPFLEVS